MSPIDTIGEGTSGNVEEVGKEDETGVDTVGERPGGQVDTAGELAGDTPGIDVEGGPAVTFSLQSDETITATDTVALSGTTEQVSNEIPVAADTQLVEVGHLRASDDTATATATATQSVVNTYLRSTNDTVTATGGHTTAVT